MAPGSIEPQVRIFSRMPKGYRFVPKGDVYITANVRKRTHDAGSTLYVVIDKNKKPFGLRCPVAVYEAVIADSLATAEARAAAVQTRDTAAERTFEEAMLKLFPKLPKAETPNILKRALKKRSGRVGRTRRIDLEEKVELAVRAHIRHNHTAYDQMMKDGMSRWSARSKVQKIIDKTTLQWGWRKSSIATASTRENNISTSRKPKAQNATLGRAESADTPGTRTGCSNLWSTNKESIELVDADTDSEEFEDDDNSDNDSDSDDNDVEEDEEDENDDDHDDEDDSFIVGDDDEDDEDGSFVLQDDSDESD